MRILRNPRCLRAAFGMLVGIVCAAAAPILNVVGPSPVAADSSFDSAMLSLLNQDRAANGVGALQWSGNLGSLAESAGYGGCGFTVRGRAEDMLQRNYMSHTILNCGSQNVFNMEHAEGVAANGAAENIGWVSGLSDPTAAAKWINQQFMQSSEHRANILNGAYNVVGVGSWWTASGQTWSGAGSAQSNVVVTAVEFITAPGVATAPPPPPPSTPRPVVHSAPRVASSVAAAPVRHEGMPETGAHVLDPGDALAAGLADTGVVARADDAGAIAATAVSARVGDSPPPSRWGVAAELACVAALLLGAGMLRARLRRRTSG